MEKFRNNKILTIIVLVVAVVGLSVGFAAFSSVLTIQSEAQVTPDASTFKVVFSNKNNSVDENNVKPTVYPTTITASDGVIENTSNPTLTGLKANFTAPGQKVVYNLYVYNAGEYLAYLNSITLKGSKSCTPGEGSDPTLVNNACEDIKLTVKVGNDSYDKTTQGITGKSIAAGSSTPIEITIEYIDGGSRADGPFSVSFNDVSLYYASVAGIDEEYVLGYTGAIYRYSEERISIGEDITVPKCVTSDEFWGDEPEEICYDTLSYETDPTNINKNYYLKHDVVDNIITASYACVTYTENGVRKDACIRGGDSSYKSLNKEIFLSMEPYFNSIGGRCAESYCYSDDFIDISFTSMATSNGEDFEGIRVLDFSSDSLLDSCFVLNDGNSLCNILDY